MEEEPEQPAKVGEDIITLEAFLTKVNRVTLRIANKRNINELLMEEHWWEWFEEQIRNTRLMCNDYDES